MSWASRRRFQYFSGFFAFLLVIIFIFIYPIIFKDPTCFDKKQNGSELGIDCGGSCSLFCQNQNKEPIILWSRAFNVTGDNYNLVALIENPNKDAAIKNISYEFKIYDNNNLLIGTREGSTYIPSNQQFAIFESRFSSGNSQLKSVTFNFTSPFIWQKKDPVLNTLPLRIDNVIFSSENGSSLLTSRMTNESIHDLKEFDVVTILYDEDYNVLNASKTYKEGILSNTSIKVMFTWPEALKKDPTFKDILPQINPFTLSF